MNNKKSIFYFLFALFIIMLNSSVFAQKKSIDHTDYAKWETLKNTAISENGSYVSYEIQPLKGDTYLYIYNVQNQSLDSIYRAKSAKFSKDEKWMVYKIETGYDTLRKLELEKVNKKKWPKDSIGIYNLQTGSIQKIADVKSFEFDQDHNVLTYLVNTNDALPVVKNLEEKVLTKKEIKAQAKAEKKADKKKKKSPVEEVEKPKKEASEGKRLHIYHLDDSTVQVKRNVDAYYTFDDSDFIALVTETNKEKALHIYDLKKCTTEPVEGLYSEIKDVVKNPFKNEFVFLTALDTGEVKVYELAKYNLEEKVKRCLIDTTLTTLPAGKTIVDNKSMYFSKANNNLLFFYVNDIPKKSPKDTLTESEKVKLDIWHYDEPTLKTTQLARLKRDLKNADLYAYNFDNNSIYLLGNDTLVLNGSHKESSTWTLASNSTPYKLSSMWDYNSLEDVYKVNLKTGEILPIKRATDGVLEMDRSGNRVISFDAKKGQYYSLDLTTNQEECITCALKGRNWSSDVNGMPMEAGPVQAFGFNQDGSCYFFADETDVFEYNLISKSLKNLSKDLGKITKKEFRFLELSSDSSFVDLNRTALKVFDKTTKGSAIYEYRNGAFVPTLSEDASIVYFNSSKNGNVRVLRKNTVSEYANLLVSANEQAFRQISTANSFQSEYKWATVELIKWKSYKGLELEGLVYKPEDFDPTKSYPMIVYYYETYSESLHAYHGARPTASIVFPTEYASNDYIIFIPDIYYNPGYPARGAYDCIMSGTDAVLKKYPNVDKDRMGLQGQSWGGYQTAMLITQTNRFKAAMAGAPVSNMFSAFGGIRWGTGMSRMGQYEKGQSRIGKTIWEAPELYTENSPLFHLPKVKTPLLIMANDQDGAVPWYQGIELFMGLRRLQKPVWMLNYNGDDHNLMKTANRYDLSIRMMQFFNHYLKNTAMPVWMKEGVPAVLKDKEMRYELVEE